jgi:hypothetical protein
MNKIKMHNESLHWTRDKCGLIFHFCISRASDFRRWVHKKHMNKLIFVLLMVIYLVGCSTSSSIQKADKSKSAFEGAVFEGESSIVSEGVPESETYRIFHQAATGFISVNTLRVSAERRANEFCAKKNKVMQVVEEHTSKPPHILGNFPRIEIIFTCVDSPETATPSSNVDDKYSRLRKLKLLLDDGIITQEEFEEEKKKILSQ